ncbi:restriction endonuclease subunit S [Mesorhizobium sp. PAMC28654]|uniref:restriction endonuclease subunit S n=1 Tax=Mesorhizobium sp. PAMC28654 TaxID=2880934 RepID=UPI001D0B9375|nr:restriction endonuclease subunit S [Mesorhizobium sp. PAMC28654]UDL92233.1 restriction endonuclease subunit S [Mesorhizobium sp. PAMC28654]
MNVRSVPIGELTTSVSTWNPVQNPEKLFRYIDLSAVDQGIKSIANASVIKGRDAPSRARQIVAFGDILVSTVRPNLNGVAPVSEEYDGATASTGFCVLRPNPDKLLSNYLMHWVRSPQFVGSMIREATGASYPAVSDRIVKNSLIPLPPLPEQQRIAAILDKADGLRRKRKHAIELLDGLTQSIFLEMFGDLAQADDRLLRNLGDLVVKIDSGWSPSCDERPASEHEDGVLKLSAVTAGGYRPSENKALPSGVASKHGIEVKKGDVLLCRKNTKNLVGASVYVWETRPRLHMSDLIFRLVPDESALDPIFLQTQISLPTLRHKISEMSGGAAGSMPNVSKSKLRDLPIVVLSLERQKRFATAARKNHAAQTAALRAFTSAERLFSSFQSRAFSGQL